MTLFMFIFSRDANHGYKANLFIYFYLVGENIIQGFLPNEN